MREFYAEASYPLDQSWAEAAFSKLLENSDRGFVWIAEHEGVAAGHAVLTLRYTMEHGALSGHIDDLFVKKELRGRGIGHALVAALHAECGRRGCKSIYVEVGDQNAAAIKLYSGFGLKPFRDGRVLFGGAVGSRDS